MRRKQSPVRIDVDPTRVVPGYFGIGAIVGFQGAPGLWRIVTISAENGWLEVEPATARQRRIRRLRVWLRYRYEVLRLHF